MADDPRRRVLPARDRESGGLRPRNATGRQSVRYEEEEQPVEPREERMADACPVVQSPSAAAVNETASTVVRCDGCGRTDDYTGHLWGNSDDVNWIQCDRCLTWHHNICVGIWSEADIPANFYCRACKSPGRTTKKVANRPQPLLPCTVNCNGFPCGRGCAAGMPTLGVINHL